ncbi:hypothetical protein OSH10_22900, partial [Kaistia defluvii]|uniref:hypothetical protein n=1 Tax=Kaistia defluvii TaxID=410841 RepID=UPI00225968BB
MSKRRQDRAGGADLHPYRRLLQEMTPMPAPIGGLPAPDPTPGIGILEIFEFCRSFKIPQDPAAMRATKSELCTLVPSLPGNHFEN